jgi:hypothetical protein
MRPRADGLELEVVGRGDMSEICAVGYTNQVELIWTFLYFYQGGVWRDS